MTALLIILCLILLIIVILSIKVKLIVHFEDKLEISIKYLFLNISVLPSKNKEKSKKSKKQKEDKNNKSKDNSIEENNTDKPSENNKKENIFVRFYHNQGFQGVLDLLSNVSISLKGMFKRIGRSFLFEELYFSFNVSGGDSAETAIKYGKTCSVAFPAFGYITSTMRVKKYNIEVIPDYLHERNYARFHVNTSVRPISLINALIIFAIQMIFKVVIKLLKYGKSNPSGSNDNK